MLFGHQINHAIEVIKAKRQPVDMGGASDRTARKIELAREYSRVVMQIVVSLAVLTVSLVLFVKSSNPDIQKVCTGFIGTVVGYWLR